LRILHSSRKSLNSNRMTDRFGVGQHITPQ
jgi:hypothetical protein